MSDKTLYRSLHWLFQQAPCFPACGRDINILESPQAFYNTLLHGIRCAKERVVMTALYLGTGHLEKCIVDELHHALVMGEKENREMDVSILIDYNRGCRENKGNSKEMLLPLVKDFQNPLLETKCSLQVCLYHSPQLRGTWKSVLPSRWNEIIGLAHMKVFIFDNTVVVTGANLSNDYFTNRQDRYIKFENNKPLADYFHSVVRALASFSFHLQHDGSVKLSDQCPHHPYEGSYNLFVSYVKSCLSPIIYPEFIHKEAKTSNQLPVFDGNQQQVAKTNNIDKFIDEKPFDTYIFPSLQLGFAGINQDEYITKGILKSAVNSAEICLTTGYFNITNDYADLIIQSPAEFSIYIASPEANGFLNAAGLSGYIPSMYIYLTKKFYDRLLYSKKGERVKIWEYIRPDWTYHAKGLWIYNQQASGPILTMIGSPNFGLRSVHRDVEAQVTVVTRNPGLMKQLHKERLKIAEFSQPVNKDTFVQPRYKVPRWVGFISSIIRKYF